MMETEDVISTIKQVDCGKGIKIAITKADKKQLQILVDIRAYILKRKIETKIQSVGRFSRRYVGFIS